MWYFFWFDYNKIILWNVNSKICRFGTARYYLKVLYVEGYGFCLQPSTRHLNSDCRSFNMWALDKQLKHSFSFLAKFCLLVAVFLLNLTQSITLWFWENREEISVLVVFLLLLSGDSSVELWNELICFLSLSLFLGVDYLL